jgi:hypothetical protein
MPPWKYMIITKIETSYFVISQVTGQRWSPQLKKPKMWQWIAWPRLSHASGGGDGRERRIGEILIIRGKSKKLGDIPAPVRLHPPQISHKLSWDWTWASAMKSHRLITWPMARPTIRRIPFNYRKQRELLSVSCKEFLFTSKYSIIQCPRYMLHFNQEPG